MARTLLEDIPEQSFTESTIKQMYRLADRGKTDAAFQKLVYGIVNHAMPGRWKNYFQEVTTVFNWFKKNVDYRRDPFGVELLQDVWATLDRKRADCDDATIWLLAAVEILGAPGRIVTVSTRRDLEPNHVFPEAFVSGRWVALDATVPASTVGWTPTQITAKRVWTRRDVGLSGGDDTTGIEGLGAGAGMSQNGNGVLGPDEQASWKTDMRPVSRALAPGVPDDVSQTWAAPSPGPAMHSKRTFWSAPVADVSDWTSNPRAGGGVFQPALPIESHPTPEELWYLVDRVVVPKVLDPLSAWWGRIPTSKEDFNRMFPGSGGTMANYLTEAASVPSSAIAEISQDVADQVRMGEIEPSEVGQAIGEALEDYALGKLPRMKRPKMNRGSRPWKNAPRPGKAPPGAGGSIWGKGLAPSGLPAIPERRYMVPGPRTRLTSIRGGRLNGPAMGALGDIISDVSNMVSAAVGSGQISSDPASIGKAIDAVLQSTTGTAPAKAPAAVTAATVAKAGIPVAVIAAVVGAALLMMGKKGKGRYQSNPRRRYGRRSRRRGGQRGGGIPPWMLWGGLGLGAYFLLLRPGAPLLPGPRTTTAAAPRPGSVSTSQQVAAMAAKAAPGLFETIKNLFTSGPTPQTTAPTTVPEADWRSTLVTSLEPAPAPAPVNPDDAWKQTLVVA